MSNKRAGSPLFDVLLFVILSAALVSLAHAAPAADEPAACSAPGPKTAPERGPMESKIVNVLWELKGVS
jgi:hypothetical protein